MKYINTDAPANKYLKAAAMDYFIDKSDLISEVVSAMKSGVPYLCVTRPRRFGKSYGANMVASFFGKAGSMRDFFSSQKVGKDSAAMAYCGKYDVVYLRGDKVTTKHVSGEKYVELIRNRLFSELKVLYPQAEISPDADMSDVFSSICEEYDDASLVFVVDEWDFILSREWTKDEDRKAYLSFLRDMLKDEEIIQLAYFTGVLPMPVFSSTSDLNMFAQFTMSETYELSTCFGFTEEEVDELYHRYSARRNNLLISRNDLRDWYEGYNCAQNVSIYNPQSVVFSLTTNSLADHWSRSGSDKEVFASISGRVGPVRDDIAKLTSGLSVPLVFSLKNSLFGGSSTRDDILSQMVVLGFLSYSDGEVKVPNRELMTEFEKMAREEPELDYIYQLASKSAEVLDAVRELQPGPIETVLEYAHNTESPLLQYNKESDLTAIVTLTFLSARNQYDVRREDKAGVGYVDFIFYPKKNFTMDGIILELKVDDTPENALQQIKDRQYILKFQGKLGERPHYLGRVLGVGIAYSKKTKKHSCRIEVLREAISL